MEGLPLGREPFPERSRTAARSPSGTRQAQKIWEDAMPFFRPDLVILQPLKPQLAFDPLA